MIPVYPTEEQAFKRVEAVKKAYRWWPGVVRHGDGTFSLTFDPAFEFAQTGEES